MKHTSPPSRTIRRKSPVSTHRYTVMYCSMQAEREGGREKEDVGKGVELKVLQLPNCVLLSCHSRKVS